MDRQDILKSLRERILKFAASRYQRDVAEDLAQEVLMVLEQKYAHLERVEDLLPLSLQILRFKMAGARRKIVRRGEHTQVPVDDLQLPDAHDDPEVATERQLIVDRLRRALPALGERCRNLMKYKLQGRTFSEIQRLMGAASINTVYTWDARCRKELLERMGGDWRT